MNKYIDLEDLKKSNEAYADRMKTIKEITEGIDINRLAEICEAEREGRLVVLPCKVGDTVYKITTGLSFYKGTHKYIREEVITKLSRIAQLSEWEDFGRNVFLTREEAEKALAEMEDIK